MHLRHKVLQLGIHHGYLSAGVDQGLSGEDGQHSTRLVGEGGGGGGGDCKSSVCYQDSPQIVKKMTVMSSACL